MDTQQVTGRNGVPAIAARGLTRTRVELSAAQRVRAEGCAARARKMARIAELHEREARWWGVLGRWTYAGSGLPLIYGKAAICAEHLARSHAESYRDLESRYWQRALAVASDSGVAA